MPHLQIMQKHEDLRTLAMARLCAPLQSSLFAECALCEADILDVRQEQRPAGPDGPVLCACCGEAAERRIPRALVMVEGIERMTAPYGKRTLDALTGSVLGYHAHTTRFTLTLEERVVLQIAAYRHRKAAA